MRTFGIGYDNVQYLPPWANTLVSLSNAGADVRVAAYMRGTKAMLVIVNGSTAAANNVGVTLKPETGLTIYGVKDAISQETLTLSGPSSFTLNIGPLDFRLILLDFGSQP